MSELSPAEDPNVPVSSRHLCPDKMNNLTSLMLAGSSDDFERQRAVMTAECPLDCNGPRRDAYGNNLAGKLLRKLNIGKDVCTRAIGMPEQTGPTELTIERLPYLDHAVEQLSAQRTEAGNTQ